MSLKYNILWVDDRKDEYQTLEIDIYLENYLKNLFFEPHIYMYENIEEAEEKLSQIKYDVIFSDYNIGEKKNGKDFIIDIRNKNIKSEILFYSAQEKPPATEMDRISFLQLQSNTAYEELKNKMKTVIDLTVAKLNDLTNLRGLVMAEVSELDMMMKEIISKYFVENFSSEKKDKFNSHIVKNAERSLRQLLKKSNCPEVCKHIWHEKNIDEIIKKPSFESSQKARTINLIINEIKFDYIPNKENFYQDYLDDIITHRNILAHCHTKLKENGIEVLETSEKDKEYSSSEINELRKNILKYREIFKELLEKIQNN